MTTSSDREPAATYTNANKPELESVLPFEVAQCATFLNAGKPPSTRCMRFGPFELRTDTRELRKCGMRVNLPAKSAQLLEALVSHPDELVTRDELYAVLWPGNVFVDFDSGLNTAVNRLRTTLGDTAESPLYIETIPRLGYRFICPVEQVNTHSPVAGGGCSPDDVDKRVCTQADVPAVALTSEMLWRLAAATVLALACAFVFLCLH